MRSSIITAMSLAGALALPQAAAAQQGPAYQQQPGVGDARIGVGLTIPFGGARTRTEPPRVELRVARDTVYLDGSRRSDRSGVQMETRIGLSLDREKQLLINGRALARGERKNISDTALILAGVGAALIVGGLVFVDAVNDASD